MIRLILLAALVIPVQALAGETHTLHATVEHEDGTRHIHTQPIDPVDCRQVVDRIRTRGPFRMRIGEWATGKVVDAKCEEKKP